MIFRFCLFLRVMKTQLVKSTCRNDKNIEVTNMHKKKRNQGPKHFLTTTVMMMMMMIMVIMN